MLKSTLGVLGSKIGKEEANVYLLECPSPLSAGSLLSAGQWLFSDSADEAEVTFISVADYMKMEKLAKKM